MAALKSYALRFLLPFGTGDAEIDGKEVRFAFSCVRIPRQCRVRAPKKQDRQDHLQLLRALHLLSFVSKEQYDAALNNSNVFGVFLAHGESS